MRRRLRPPSPSLVISLIALFVALGGTTYAATSLPTNSVGTAQLRQGAVTKTKINKKTIEALKGQRGPRGATGAEGPQGQTGQQGATGGVGPSNGYSTYNPAGVFLTGDFSTLASLTLGTGSYLVTAKATVTYPSGASVECRLLDNNIGSPLDDTEAGGATASSGVNGSISLVAPLTTQASIVSVACADSMDPSEASNVHLAAIKVGAVSGS